MGELCDRYAVCVNGERASIGSSLDGPRRRR
jgi:hypothetical protein